jgi:hypothetical protein
VPVALPPPQLIAPAAHEVSFGRIAGRAPRPTRIVTVAIDGRVVARRDLRGARTRFDFHIQLPSRELRLTVFAVVDENRRSSTTVRPVFGLPRAAAPRAPPRGREDARLARSIRGLARAFPGTCAIFVQDLRSGAAASWNARVAFPGASLLKVAIALQVLIAHRGRPPPGSRVDRLLRRMLIPSEDRPANELLVWLGGSTSAGSARVNATLRALGLNETDMYGGYEVQAEAPSFVGKRTTASDFGRLLRYLHLAADGKGRLAQRFRGSFVPADARFLLYLLAKAQPNWLGRYLPHQHVAIAHKPGWITKARHDAGVAYSRGGAFVAVVLTWNARGVGAASEILAGRVARAAFARFKRSRPARSPPATPERGPRLAASNRLRQAGRPTLAEVEFARLVDVHLAAGLLESSSRPRRGIRHHDDSRSNGEHIAALELELVGIAMEPADAALVQSLEQGHRTERFVDEHKVVCDERDDAEQVEQVLRPVMVRQVESLYDCTLRGQDRAELVMGGAIRPVATGNGEGSLVEPEHVAGVGDRAVVQPPGARDAEPGESRGQARRLRKTRRFGHAELDRAALGDEHRVVGEAGVDEPVRRPQHRHVDAEPGEELGKRRVLTAEPSQIGRRQPAGGLEIPSGRL